jgi:hypothetical protein
MQCSSPFNLTFSKRPNFPLLVEPSFLEMSNLALEVGLISPAICYHHIILMICFYNEFKWYLLYLMTHECEQGSHIIHSFDIRCIKMHDKLDTREMIPWLGLWKDQRPSWQKPLWFENLASFMSDWYSPNDRNPMAFIFFLKK